MQVHEFYLKLIFFKPQCFIKCVYVIILLDFNNNERGNNS